ncbi:MAG: hypothetical protein JWM37_83 [Candidatus Saccharibacteria bacterium]|nr:hypothetical protein [Candidatus Saccharibacteria bacterium]
MNDLDKLIHQTRVYLAVIIAAENLLLIGWLLLGWFLQLSAFIIIPGAAAIVLGGCLIITIAGAHHVLGPIKTVWQAVLHISPTNHEVAAPELDKIRYGRELLVNLIGQIYQLNNVATGQSMAQQAERADLKNEFVAANLPLPLVVLDAQENVVFMNTVASKYLHKSPEELVGKSIYSALDMSFPNENTFDKWLAEAKANTVIDYNSWERVRFGLADQTSLQFDLSAYYNKDNSNGYETMIVLFDHTAQYGQDDQAVSFIALAVHELRTPLTLLRGYIETFQDEFAGKLDPELDGFMHRMDAAGQQLADFVSNILHVARVEDDQLMLELHEEDVSEVVSAALKNYEVRAKVRGMTILPTIAPDLPSAAIDRVSFYEILGNLLDNAIKYSGDSTQIKVNCTMSPEGMIQIDVEDSGVGIPTNVVPNLFTKFYRNHRTRNMIGGTGLGLYLCKALVSAHGGHIWVRSEEGKGSTFSFTIQPYSQLAEELKSSNNKDITRGAHGWIKNHSLYRQ